MVVRLQRAISAQIKHSTAQSTCKPIPWLRLAGCWSRSNSRLRAARTLVFILGLSAAVAHLVLIASLPRRLVVIQAQNGTDGASAAIYSHASIETIAF